MRVQRGRRHRWSAPSRNFPAASTVEDVALRMDRKLHGAFGAVHAVGSLDLRHGLLGQIHREPAGESLPSSILALQRARADQGVDVGELVGAAADRESPSTGSGRGGGSPWS